MALGKSETLHEFEALRRQISRFMESFFTKEPMGLAEDGWTPAYDLIEDKDGLMVKVELPGVEEDDLSLTLLGQNLIIKGERKAAYDKSERDRQVHCVERWQGSFERSIPIPVSIATDKIKANYRKGVLVIYLPKKSEGKPKEIHISLE